jgi:hypothetical protein
LDPAGHRSFANQVRAVAGQDLGAAHCNVPFGPRVGTTP